MKEIELSQGKVALVDDEDHEWLSKFSWHYSGGIASCNKKGSMHRVIIKAPKGRGVLHKDNNKLNNQRHNLELCKRSEDIIGYYKNAYKEWAQNNKNRIAASKKKYRETPLGKDSTIKNYLWRKYKLTLEQYEDMVNKQEGVCAICKKLCRSGQRLSVDHDHKTGKVRELLCRSCNVGIGYIENAHFRAFEYLSRYKPAEVHFA